MDGKVRTVGEPLPQEQDLHPARVEAEEEDEIENFLYEDDDELAKSHYYMSESNELQRRFGIKPFEDGGNTGYRVVAMLDRKDYSHLHSGTQNAPSLQPAAKPWWKFW